MQEEQNKVYVGNLDFGLSEDALKNAFTEKGISSKSVKIIKDKYTGKSKGFGFVEVDSNEDIQKSIELLNGQDLNGRKLKVSEAKAVKQRFDNKQDRGGNSRFFR